MTALTVGICAYNEEWNIGSLLDNILRAQGISKNSEVIVVCSGCIDDTARIVRKIALNDKRVRLIEEPDRLGKAAAVSRILSKARGDYIVFISADVTPKPGCLMSLVTAMDDPKIGIACGKPEPVSRGKTLVRGIVGTLWGFHNWQLEKLNHFGTLMHASELFCIRRGIVNRIPNGMINDDAFIAVATKSAGYMIKYVPESRVEVFGPQTIGDYVKQRRRIIVGHYQVRKATGKFSQYLFYSLLARPRLTLNILMEYFAGTHTVRSGITAGLIEVIANLLALGDLIRGKSHAVWSISTTTKTAKEI